MQPRSNVTIYLTQHDLDALARLTEQYERAPRHLVLLAAFRKGLELLEADPASALEVVQDQARAKFARVR